MLIAHAPNGYIVSKAIHKRYRYVVYSLIFSVWPDLDLIYYYFFDRSGYFHHTYITHLPFAILIGFLVTLPLTCLNFSKRFRIYYWLFFINWSLHLLLDTFTGGIMWLYPFSNEMFLMIEIPAISQNWIVSFVLHWSFMIESAIVALSAIIWIQARYSKNTKS